MTLNILIGDDEFREALHNESGKLRLIRRHLPNGYFSRKRCTPGNTVTLERNINNEFRKFRGIIETFRYQQSTLLRGKDRDTVTTRFGNSYITLAIIGIKDLKEI